MANSMQHWNGNQLVVIDVETTGLNHHIHEIWQIACLALDSNIEIRKDVAPFYMLMTPNDPALIDWSIPVMIKNKEKIIKAINTGFDQEKAKDLFEYWIGTLKLPLNAGGINQCKILPLGHNFGQFDHGFLKTWLGDEGYDEYFLGNYRDTFVLGNYLNDRAAWSALDKVPYSKTNLRWMCHQNNVALEERDTHDALLDCKATAELYKKLVSLPMNDLFRS